MGILIIDHREEPRKLLEQLLRRAGFDVSFLAGSLAEAPGFQNPDTDPAGSGPSVDLILLDLHMPEPAVIETVKRLRQHPRHHDIPILLVAEADDSSGLAAALDAGADDFIALPARPLELAARVRTALRLKQETDRRRAREAELRGLNQRLSVIGRNLERLAFLDGLTGIPNRRYFDEVYAREWGRAARENHPLGLILSDIDHFKRYNDTWGHQEGDTCLRRVAAALTGTIKRPADFVARYGGEEFVLLLPGTDAQGTAALAESLRKAVLDLKLPHGDSPVSEWVTLSLGGTSILPQEEPSAHAFLARADQALYQAKESGRNRVCMF